MFSSILTIDKVNADFDGKIKVVLKNDLGEVVSTTQLNVKRRMYTMLLKGVSRCLCLASMAVQLQTPPKKTSVVEALTPSPDE